LWKEHRQMEAALEERSAMLTWRSELNPLSQHADSSSSLKENHSKKEERMLCSMLKGAFADLSKCGAEQQRRSGAEQPRLAPPSQRHIKHPAKHL
jgi:hypothetical protein